MKKCAQKRDSDRERKIKPWEQAVGELTQTFLSYRKIDASVLRERKRALFYDGFQRMSLAAAMSTLARNKWGGDQMHDSEDIVSACVITLLKQEQKDCGLFRKPHPPINQLRGYLSQVIWNGVKQQAKDYFLKERHCWNHEQLDLRYDDFIDGKIAGIALQIDLKEALKKVAAEERTIFKLSGGVIPLDGVLGKEIAGTILTHLPKRTWQRYCRQSRERLGKELCF